MAMFKEALPGPEPKWDGNGAVIGLRWRFPIPRPYAGVPMGNGNMGALIWGGERLCVTVSLSDFWDHRGSRKLPRGNMFQQLRKAHDPHDPGKLENSYVHETPPDGIEQPTRLPCGRFEFELAHGLRLQGALLSFLAGEVSIGIDNPVSGGKHSITLWMCAADNLLCIHDPDGCIISAVPRPAWEWNESGLTARGFRPPVPLQQDGDGVRGWIQECPNDPTLAAATASEDAWHRIFICRGSNCGDARKKIIFALGSSSGTEKMKTATAAWWQDYWGRAAVIKTSSEFHDAFFRYAQYCFACATNPNGGVPAGLQGPWIDEQEMPSWGADYHFNCNVQLLYTLAFANNTPRHALPLFDMVDGWRGLMRDTARMFFGVDDALHLFHATTDQGLSTYPIASWGILDYATTGWTAYLYWLYYQHTGDTHFLRERAWPFLKGALCIYEVVLDKENDRFTIPIGVSPEYYAPILEKPGHRQRVGRNPSYQLACLHALLDAALEASSILRETPKPEWMEMKRCTPPWILIGTEGEERIGIWEKQDLEYSHRHHSHLACVYPFDTIRGADKKTQSIITNTVRRSFVEKGIGLWDEWSLPWAAIIAARLGLNEAPIHLLNIFRSLFLNEGWQVSYKERFEGGVVSLRANSPARSRGEVIQLDGMMAAATAVLEMLAHTRDGMIRVFPAVPDCWSDVSFSRICVPGPFLVGGIKRNGRVEEITVRSLEGGSIRVDAPGVTRMRRSSDRVILELPALLTLEKNEEARLIRSRL